MKRKVHKTSPGKTVPSRWHPRAAHLPQMESFLFSFLHTGRGKRIPGSSSPALCRAPCMVSFISVSPASFFVSGFPALRISFRRDELQKSARMLRLAKSPCSTCCLSRETDSREAIISSPVCTQWSSGALSLKSLCIFPCPTACLPFPGGYKQCTKSIGLSESCLSTKQRLCKGYAYPTAKRCEVEKISKRVGKAFSFSVLFWSLMRQLSDK